MCRCCRIHSSLECHGLSRGMLHGRYLIDLIFLSSISLAELYDLKIFQMLSELKVFSSKQPAVNFQAVKQQHLFGRPFPQVHEPPIQLHTHTHESYFM